MELELLLSEILVQRVRESGEIADVGRRRAGEKDFRAGHVLVDVPVGDGSDSSSREEDDSMTSGGKEGKGGKSQWRIARKGEKKKYEPLREGVERI